jgi:hypothetical protein
MHCLARSSMPWLLNERKYVMTEQRKDTASTELDEETNTARRQKILKRLWKLKTEEHKQSVATANEEQVSAGGADRAACVKGSRPPAYSIQKP